MCWKIGYKAFRGIKKFPFINCLWSTSSNYNENTLLTCVASRNNLPSWHLLCSSYEWGRDRWWANQEPVVSRERNNPPYESYVHILLALKWRRIRNIYSASAGSFSMSITTLTSDVEVGRGCGVCACVFHNTLPFQAVGFLLNLSVISNHTLFLFCRTFFLEPHFFGNPFYCLPFM